MKILRAVAIVVLLGVTTASFAIDDTPENRTAQINRYLAATPISDMMRDMADAMAMNLPPSDRAAFRDVLTKYINHDVLATAMAQAMSKHFTANELEALADLYSSPVGKSAMSKMGVYMAEVMPVVQAEVLRAFGEAEKAKAEANRELPDIEE